ncbi:hypothetical protein, partial [Frankia sp. AgKG'84/4]|uniref:hypothetical protein n=1 Tax=Frankia sp. AgKG'84/4 TaxID=573490 RepID=UPI00202A27E8
PGRPRPGGIAVVGAGSAPAESCQRVRGPPGQRDAATSARSMCRLRTSSGGIDMQEQKHGGPEPANPMDR